MMEQANPTRLEEYVTLREEMLSLFAHGRDILYWTTAFIVLILGWYTTQPEARKLIPPYLLTSFLFGILILSAITYSIAMDQAYRIGSYVAIFWESNDPNLWLKWHRFNRHGPSGGFRANTGAFVYLSMALVVLFFFEVFVYNREVQLYVAIGITLVAIGTTIVLPLSVGTRLRTRRVGFENGWRLIRGSPARQAQIHQHYETLPPRA